MTTQTYPIVGLTCGHCVAAVADELGALPGVTEVDIDLVAHGTSTMHVTSEAPLDGSAIAAALDEAGDYRLADG